MEKNNKSVIVKCLGGHLSRGRIQAPVCVLLLCKNDLTTNNLGDQVTTVTPLFDNTRSLVSGLSRELERQV